MEEDEDDQGREIKDIGSGCTDSDSDSSDDGDIAGPSTECTSGVEQKDESSDSDSSVCSLVEAPVIVSIRVTSVFNFLFIFIYGTRYIRFM